MYSAWRSRWITWVLASAGVSPSRAQTSLLDPGVDRA